MFTLLITLIVIVSLLLIVVVLAQNPKGGGLSGQFGGSGASQIMGVKRTSDLLEKLTWGFAIALVLFALSSHIFLPNNQIKEGFTSPNIEEAEQNAATPGLDNELPIDAEGEGAPQEVDTTK